MGKKFVLSDLDGTLLDQPDGLSEPYLRDLNELIDEGLNFSIATGRDMEKARKAVPGLILKYPVILTNGALLGDLVNMKYLQITHIPPFVVEDIMNLAAQISLPPMVFAAYDSQKDIMHFNKGKWGPKGIRPLSPDRYQPFQYMDVVSIQFHKKKEDLDPLKATIESQFHDKVNMVYIEDIGYRNATNKNGWYWLEINSVEAGKENMLKHLAQRLHIPLEEIIVFGDNDNDVEMLKTAGKGIAVENATVKAKTVAKEICGSNLHGGVIEYLKQHKEELI